MGVPKPPGERKIWDGASIKNNLLKILYNGIVANFFFTKLAIFTKADSGHILGKFH